MGDNFAVSFNTLMFVIGQGMTPRGGWSGLIFGMGIGIGIFVNEF
jgi:hypothetical protein